MNHFDQDVAKGSILGERIVATHQISRYSFIETGGDGNGKMPVHIYVDGKRIGRMIDSLDAAIAIALAWHYDGPNSQAGTLFCRMIGLEV